MSEDFWINIAKPGFFYIIEKWSVGEDRILYVEKKKALTKFGAKRYAKRCIINNVCSAYIKEKK
jgi:hypothetical protein